MQVERGLFQIAMTEQQLDRAQIGSGFEQMSGKAVPQSVRMDLISQSGSCSSPPASLPDDFAGNGPFPGVPTVARKQPEFRSLPESSNVAPQFIQEFRAEHDIAVFAALSALDVDVHSLAIDIAHLQMRQFGTPQSGGIQSHQEDAVEHGWEPHR